MTLPSDRETYLRSHFGMLTPDDIAEIWILLDAERAKNEGLRAALRVYRPDIDFDSSPSPTPLQEAVRTAAEQVVSDWHDGKDMFDSTHELSRALSRLSHSDAPQQD